MAAVPAPSSPPRTPADLLARALADDPARPLLTAYDDDTGERTELSVLTFANWVAKTANLLRDDLAVPPGARIAVRLPLHWQAAVWLQAAWALGLAVDLDVAGQVDVAVVEHPAAGLAPMTADEVVSLGLGPMGLARPGVVPAYPGALDYDREIHGHGDRFIADAAPDPAAPALHAGGRDVSATALVGAALGSPPVAAGGRLLVTEPLRTVESVLGALLVPLATGTTAVLCAQLDESRLANRIRQENLVAALPGAPGGLPAYRPAAPA